MYRIAYFTATNSTALDRFEIHVQFLIEGIWTKTVIPIFIKKEKYPNLARKYFKVGSIP